MTQSMQREANSTQRTEGRVLFVLCPLLALYLCLLCAVSYGQGFLPPASSSSTTTAESQGPLLIGDKVPVALTVPESDGEKRNLISYKAALEVMVVGFFSADCPPKESHWSELAHFYRDYKDWSVSFLGVNAGDAASHAELAKEMKKAGLDFLLVNDEVRTLSRDFKIVNLPELVIIDESGNLRYRGPVGKDARAAIEAVIGHMVPVPNPEPPDSGGCPVSQ
jgi:peroxiredoxin